MTGLAIIDTSYLVLYYNEACARYYKKLTGSVLYEGMNIIENLPEHRKGPVKDSIQRAINGETVLYEIEYHAPTYTWVRMQYDATRDKDGKITAVCCIIEDITQKKLLEQTVHQKEIEFAATFRFSGIGKALVAIGGSFIDVNPALCKLMGYTREELLQKSFQEITHPDDLQRDLDLLQQVLNGKANTYQMEKRYLHKNGSVIWAMLTVALVPDTDGKPRYLIAQVVDISATKAMVKELETKNHALDFAAHDMHAKMKQLEEFTHMAGHNLRGGTANIKAMAGLMAEASPDEMPLWINRLKTAANGLYDALTELLQFSQVKLTGEVPFEPCNIRALCNEVLPQVAPPEDDDGFKITYDLEVKTINYSKVYLQNILYNLLSNAFKYRKRNEVLKLTISCHTENEHVVLKIADNGIGFDAEANQEKIFTLNGTFHKGYNSKGIGLFITRAQVEKLGGSISVESRVGEGTTFTVVL